MHIVRLQSLLILAVLLSSCGVKRVQAQNALTPVPKQQFFANNGTPLAGGQLFTYVAGTSTLQATYVSSSGAANSNPIILDSAGRADVWLGPGLAYKMILKDSGGTQIWSEDNITAAPLDMATTDTTQTITGNKTFSGTTTIGTLNLTGTVTFSGPAPNFTTGLSTSGNLSVTGSSTLTGAATFPNGWYVGTGFPLIHAYFPFSSVPTLAIGDATNNITLEENASGFAQPDEYFNSTVSGTVYQKHVSATTEAWSIGPTTAYELINDSGAGEVVLFAPGGTNSVTLRPGTCQLIMRGASHTIILDCAAGQITVDGTPITVP